MDGQLRGSCKLIFCDKDGDLSYAIRKRDQHEAQRIADIEADYYHNIKFQEKLFKTFSEKYEAIKILIVVTIMCGHSHTCMKSVHVLLACIYSETFLLQSPLGLHTCKVS